MVGRERGLSKPPVYQVAHGGEAVRTLQVHLAGLSLDSEVVDHMQVSDRDVVGVRRGLAVSDLRRRKNDPLGKGRVG